MAPYKNLSTERLNLRQLGGEDLQQIFALRSDEMIGKYIDRPIPQHISEAAAFIERIQKGYTEGATYYWVACRKENDELIGTICLWNISADGTVAEIGYEMLPEHQGKGYVQEAIAAVSDFSFNALELKAIDAFTHRDNAASRNVLERNGFTLCEDRQDPDAEVNVVYTKVAMSI